MHHDELSKMTRRKSSRMWRAEWHVK